MDQDRTVELTQGQRDPRPAAEQAAGFKGYYMIESGDGVFSSLGLFENPEQIEESTKIASSWVRDEKLETAFPNPPKITSGKIVTHRATASPSRNGPTETRSPAKGRSNQAVSGDERQARGRACQGCESAGPPLGARRLPLVTGHARERVDFGMASRGRCRSIPNQVEWRDRPSADLSRKERSEIDHLIHDLAGSTERVASIK